MCTKRVLLVLLVTCLYRSPLEASLKWDIHMVREDTGAGGSAVTMKPTPDGKFGIVEYTSGDLYYNYGSGSSWHSSLIDSDVHGDDRSNWALDYDPVSGSPYVAYQSKGGAQYIAHYVGSAWVRETVMPANSARDGCGLAFDPRTNSPVVVFDPGFGLQYAWKDQGMWQRKKLISPFFDCDDPSVGFSPVTGRALVSYGYFADGVFVMSEQEDGSWRNSQAAKASHPCNTTLTFAPDDGAPVVAYSCGLAGPLGFAKYDGAKWVDFPRTHDGIWNDYGFAFSGPGEPLIAYNADIGDNDGFFLDAYKDGGWQRLSSYDYGRLNFGGGVDLVADSEGYHIAYKSWNNGLYYAFAVPEPGSVLLMITGSLILLRRNKGQR